MMVPPEERSYPMAVVTLASAKVQELIGLICWQYTMEGRQPPLQSVMGLYTGNVLGDCGGDF